MVSLRPLVERRGLDAGFAWLATAVLVACAGRFLLLGELDWAAFVAIVVGVALVPPVLERDPAVTMPSELLVLVAVPAVVRAAAVVSVATPFFVLAGLSLLVAVLLDSYTSLTVTPRFAVVFVVLTTMAFAGVWTVGSWVSDALFRTDILPDETELMWDLVAATVTGILAGVVFELYFRVSDRVTRLDGPAGSTDGTEHDGESTADIVDLPGDRNHHRTAVRVMRALLVLIAVAGLLRANVGLFVNGGVTLLITFVPAALRREYDYPMDPGLTLWVTVAVFLHAVGALGPYESVAFYDTITHTLSATLLAGIGFAVARAVELHSRSVDFDATFRSVFVVVFVLAAGVAWEILEFASGGVASIVGGDAVLTQYGTGDIVHDLAFNTVGAIIVAILSTGRFEAVARTLAGEMDVLVRGGE